MINLGALIEEGEQLKKQVKQNDWGGNVLEGEELETWSAKCVIYIDENVENEFLSNKVKENARDLTKDGYKKYLAILGILKAFHSA